MKKSLLIMMTAVLLALCTALLPGSFAEGTPEEAAEHKGYTLKQVVILSRHNIRSPLSTKGSNNDGGKLGGASRSQRHVAVTLPIYARSPNRAVRRT